MNISAKSPATALQILEQHAEVASRREEESLVDFDLTSQADWDDLIRNRQDAQISVWARNDLHRLQHQTAKSVLAST